MATTLPTMTDIAFAKNEEGFYEGSFQSSGGETVIYLNRNDNGFLSIGSTPDPATVEPCMDYADINAYKDESFRIKYPENVTVIILSETSVPLAKYITE